jgi:2-Cys peroxiredoxin 5
MLADTHCELTNALGLVLDAESVLGNKRCKRFSAYVVDNVIKSLNVEADGAGLSCSLAPEVLS